MAGTKRRSKSDAPTTPVYVCLDGRLGHDLDNVQARDGVGVSEHFWLDTEGVKLQPAS